MLFSDRPQAKDFIRFSNDFGQRFTVTVDVEEEFDWDRPIRREGWTLKSLEAILDFQALCENYRVRPIYLVDYPVIADPHGAEIYGSLVREGRADVGVQLHPWVNPPFDEEVIPRNTFAGNLPRDLERQKFRILFDTIAEATGQAPTIYRAGRYGVGDNSASMLAEAGIAIDTSVRSKFDYSAEGGPDYSRHPLKPYWIDRAAGLAEFPVTSVYWGLLRQQGDMLYPSLYNMPNVRAIAARAGMLERIALTPEGISVEEAIRGIDIALDDGLPVLTFSFHSPSLLPGFTPYVSNEAEAEAFHDWFERVFAYLQARGVRPASLDDLLAETAAARDAA